MIRPLPHIADMAAYAVAELDVPAGKTLVSLSQNESLRGPSPMALDAASTAIAQAQLYPEMHWPDLRQALATFHGIQSANVVCGNGSLDIIAAIARCYCDRENACLAPEHAYPFFKTAAAMVGARFDTAPEDKTTVSIPNLLAAVQPDTRVVFVANPGNPTGTRISKTQLQALRDGLPCDVLLVIDEAYAEFTDALGERCFDMIEDGNTIVLRTFSKAYGLAGMRIGWGYCAAQICTDLHKVLNPNNLSVAGEAAAVAALQDQGFMLDTCAQTIAARSEFTSRLRTAGFDVGDSHTNFVLIHFDSASKASDVDSFLKSHGVFLRPQGGVGLPHCLRATIAEQPIMDKVATLLESYGQGTPS